MSEHFVVTVDCGHYRIFAQRSCTGSPMRLESVETMEFPSALRSDTGASADGRLLGGAAGSWWSTANLAGELETFLQSRPGATWDFAASPEFHDALIARLSDETLHRLKRSIVKDLTGASAEDVRVRFAEAG